jgi:hypothetical protein
MHSLDCLFGLFVGVELDKSKALPPTTVVHRNANRAIAKRRKRIAKAVFGRLELQVANVQNSLPICLRVRAGRRIVADWRIPHVGVFEGGRLGTVRKWTVREKMKPIDEFHAKIPIISSSRRVIVESMN